MRSMRKESRFIFHCFFLLLLSARCLGFVLPGQSQINFRVEPLQNDRFNRDLDERSVRKAQGQGGGEMAAGAVLGGLVAGPFGVLFGAQIGANLGAKNSVNKSRNEEMERLGITQEMLDATEEVGIALEQSVEGLRATKVSLQTQQSLARRLEHDADELYEKAKEAMTSGNEEGARTLLLKRNENQDKLVKILKLCVDEKKRLETLEKNVEAIERRALEVESLLQRSVGAKARQSAAFNDLSFSSEDPLLQKFRDMGID